MSGTASTTWPTSSRLILAAADGDEDEDEVRRCIGQYEEWGDVGSSRLVPDLATFGAGAGVHLILSRADRPW